MKFIVGNWKMNGNLKLLQECLSQWQINPSSNQVVLCLPAVFLEKAKAFIRLLAEPTSDRQVQEATGALEQSVHEVHEHSSTEATPQLSAEGRLCKKSTEQVVLSQVEERDQRDQNRSQAPLRIAEDAHLIDTTTLSIEEACRLAADFIEELLHKV